MDGNQGQKKMAMATGAATAKATAIRYKLGTELAIVNKLKESEGNRELSKTGGPAGKSASLQ
ncbi:hypothetical protein KQ302_11880 [Synechococcus sp. CS-602]|uniref:hypothetical protein n=1 Tax=Synechococcaceae TaxID=1890426 RepID=UPI0008FF1763|nr:MULTISPECIES: hypothetical protein [Synechococcaceae]APD47839.1 hypothetical protein BM449_05670 [Synechococcus sp. SynAce01]MCT0202937.1 hypothetical protein [Synechococcus sp. CS-603]MCT0205790.1 hypothetical protein [Synechococcus sp. CS-602]MCT0245196.1 hypothetical protein [Synechococcus sp. CS-601]MCT4367195.1 hypothetical protein [Candidatus Regnicoccus frigidus MAG-AL2]